MAQTLQSLYAIPSIVPQLGITNSFTAVNTFTAGAIIQGNTVTSSIATAYQMPNPGSVSSNWYILGTVTFSASGSFVRLQVHGASNFNTPDGFMVGSDVIELRMGNNASGASVPNVVGNYYRLGDQAPSPIRNGTLKFVSVNSSVTDTQYQIWYQSNTYTTGCRLYVFSNDATFAYSGAYQSSGDPSLTNSNPSLYVYVAPRTFQVQASTVQARGRMLVNLPTDDGSSALIVNGAALLGATTIGTSLTTTGPTFLTTSGTEYDLYFRTSSSLATQMYFAFAATGLGLNYTDSSGNYAGTSMLVSRSNGQVTIGNLLLNGTATLTGTLTSTGVIIADQINMSGNVSSAFWGANGIGWASSNQTFTDTSSATGTIASENAAYVLKSPTFTSSASGVVYSGVASTFKIGGAPINGTNVTLGTGSNCVALYVAAGGANIQGSLWVSGTGTNFSNAQSAASATSALQIAGGGYAQAFSLFPNMSAGSYNPIVTATHSALVYSQGAQATYGFYIIPWSTASVGSFFGPTGTHSVYTSGQVAGIIVKDFGSNGAGIQFTGSNASTPNKTIRVGTTGNLEFVNSAYNGIPMYMTDGGTLIMAGSMQSSGITLFGTGSESDFFQCYNNSAANRVYWALNSSNYSLCFTNSSGSYNGSSLAMNPVSGALTINTQMTFTYTASEQCVFNSNGAPFRFNGTTNYWHGPGGSGDNCLLFTYNAASNYNWTFYGNATSGNFTISSDQRIKTWIDDLNGVTELERLMMLKPRLYYKDDKPEYGFYAQDVKEVYAPMVTTRKVDGYDWDDFHLLDMNMLHAVHISATQALNIEVKALRKEVAELKARLHLG